MNDDHTLSDRVAIDALRSEFTDAVMMRDYDRVASLFTSDGQLRIPDIPVDLTGPDEIRSWGRRVPETVAFLVQHAHPGAVAVDGDTAAGRVFIEELVCARDGRSGLNFAIYHDEYRRVDHDWKFARRTYEIRYLDTTPLAGNAPAAAHRPDGSPSTDDAAPRAASGDHDTLPLAAGRWALDDAHTAVGFTIKHLGVSKVRGRFDTFEAEVVVGADLASSRLEACIALDSITTGSRDRDTNAQSALLLDVARRPTLRFRSESVRAVGAEVYEIAGHVTIGEVTRPLVLHAAFGGIETAPDGRRHAGFEATGQLRRKEFGIGPDVPAAMLGDVITIELDTQLVEPPPAA